MTRRGGSRASRGVTIRTGTGERHWYFIAGYVAVAVIGILYAVIADLQYGGEAGGIVFGLVLFGLAFGGFASFISLFKDSAYLRGTHAGWSPKWWYYIGVPVGISVVTILGGALGNILGTAFVLTIIIFAIAALVSNTWYLYRRHQYIGVP